MFSEFNTIFCIDVSIGFKSKILMSNFFASTTNPPSAIGVWTTRAPMFGKAPTWAPRCPLGLQKGAGANRRKISVLTFKDDTIFYI